jgi:integrase/recombinase XerD
MNSLTVINQKHLKPRTSFQDYIIELKKLNLLKDIKWSAGTYSNYTVKVKKFNEYLEENPGKNLLDFFAYLEKNFEIRTAHNYKAAIKAAFIQDMKRNKIDSIENITHLETVFKNIKPGKIDKKIHREKVLSKQELSALYEKAGYKTKLYCQALYWTGGRVSELVNIKLAHCQARNNGMIIRIVGKGKKQRSVYMPVSLFEEIQATFKGSKYLFENKQGQPVSRSTLLTLVKRVGCKIERSDIHPHTLRHTFATTRLQDGDLNIFEIQDYLGHSKLSTTEMYISVKASMERVLNTNQGVN